MLVDDINKEFLAVVPRCLQGVLDHFNGFFLGFIFNIEGGNNRVECCSDAATGPCHGHPAIPCPSLTFGGTWDAVLEHH